MSNHAISRALLVGFVAGLLVLVPLALALSVMADAGGWNGLDVSVGPMSILVVTKDSAGSTTTFGVGLVALAAAFAVVNAISAGLVHRRSARSSA